MDFLDGATFKGYSLNETWNGWACPYFDLEESKKIVEEWNKRGLKANFDEVSDVFIFEIGEESETEEFGSIQIEEKKLYPIGTSDWIWEEKDSD